MKKPRHNFNLESKANQSGEKLIYLNFSYGFKEYNSANSEYKYTPLRLSTKWTIKEEFWNGKPTYRANQIHIRKYGKDINVQLEKIESLVYHQLSLFRNEHECNPTPKELKRLVFEKLDRIEKVSDSVIITEYITQEIDRRTALPKTMKEHWGKTTKNAYLNLVNHIKKYESHKNTILTFGEITEKIYLNYFETISEINKEKTGSYYIHNTIAKECKNLRVILNSALNNDIKIGFNFNKRGLRISETERQHNTYLNESQLKTIINTDTNHSNQFTQARNYIIISSFTGLRIGDMKHLCDVEPEEIMHESTKYNLFQTRIRKSQENKEELVVAIPILKPVEKILKENNNRFPKFTSEPNLRKAIKGFLQHLEFNNPVTVSKNYYLSDNLISKQEKQSDVYTPHDCRRTFISNLRELNVHNEEIEPITHPKVKYTSVLDSYDKRNIVLKAISFINALNSKESELYKY
ncbi:phage integrase SAM-like domain-containing protein [Oceanihabitans sp.]|nr:phage integrase SAM-like domain-containing protein [Oceanihabitans sp.]